MTVRPPAKTSDLDAAAPSLSTEPKRWWLLIIFAAVLAIVELGQPRLWPPGWPDSIDKLAILSVPVSALFLTFATSLPESVIGFYGVFAACVFLCCETDNWHSSQPTDAQFAVNWSIYMAVLWIICRSCASLRVMWNQKISE